MLCSAPLVKIRKHPNNMSKNADRMRQSMRKVLKKHLFAEGGQILPLTLLKAFSFHQFEVAWMYYDERRIGLAIYALISSLLLWPYFPHPRTDLDQPPLFRIRGLARFLLGGIGFRRA